VSNDQWHANFLEKNLVILNGDHKSLLQLGRLDVVLPNLVNQVTCLLKCRNYGHMTRYMSYGMWVNS
jgi:hypothetical protein